MQPLDPEIMATSQKLKTKNNNLTHFGLFVYFPPVTHHHPFISTKSNPTQVL